MRGTSTNTASSPETLTVEVERGGRRFPLNWETTRSSNAAASRLRQLREDRTDTVLAETLGQSLWNSLAWSGLTAAIIERQTYVQAYVSSLNQLGDRRREVEALVRAASEANLEFRQAEGRTHAQARDTALAQQLDKKIAEAGANWEPARNILDAALVSQPLPRLRERLESSLTEAVNHFTQEFLLLLARMVDRGQVGLVEWLPNNCCSYHFFRQVVIQHRGRTTEREVRQTIAIAPQLAPRYTVVGTRTMEQTTRGQHAFRLARHEHEVMNAVRTTIANSRVVIPPPVARLIENVPRWLYPGVEIIDGQIFRERIIERDTGVADWTDVEVRDEPIFGSDPAVIIGPYVLVGWGPREIEEEERRRAAEHVVADTFPSTEAAPVWLTISRALFGSF
jgi:hypothetical protein